MSRKHNIMVAALVTAALGSAWFFADVGRAPFSRKGMSAPVEQAESAQEAAPQQSAEPTAEELEQLLEAIERRTELAAGVKDAASARAFVELVQAQQGVTKRAFEILYLLQTGVDSGEEGQHPALVARLEEIERVFREHVSVLNAMYNRLYEAEGYGDPQLQTCLAFNGAIMFPMIADNALRVVDNRRDMAEWERRQAEADAEDENAPPAPAPQCRYADLARSVDWMLRNIRQRTKFAAAVRNYATAKTYANFNRPELGGRGLNLIKEAMSALDPEEKHDCPSVQAIRARREEITEAWNALQQAEADMRARAAAADYYGVPELAEEP